MLLWYLRDLSGQLEYENLKSHNYNFLGTKNIIKSNKNIIRT